MINPLLDTLDRECQGNDICHKLVCGDAETNSLFMYADDFVCVCESKEALQRAVNICQKCVNFFNLKANVKKSAVMRFFRKCVKKRKRQATLKSEVFNWGEKGPELPNVTKYKYLGMKLDTDLNWIEHFKKANEKFWLAMNKCKTTFEEPFLDVQVKLDMKRAVVDPVHTFRFDLIHMLKKQKNETNVRQMKALKKALTIETQNHNSLLRLMFGEVDVDTLQTISGINLLRKNWKMKSYCTPNMILNGWESKTLRKGKYKSQLRDVWEKHKHDVMNLKKQATKSKWSKVCYDKLVVKLKATTKLPVYVTRYVRQKKWKRCDPIVNVLTSVNLSRWLNLCNSQRDDKYDISPLCGETDSVQHTLCDCVEIKHLGHALEVASDTT